MSSNGVTWHYLGLFTAGMAADLKLQLETEYDVDVRVKPCSGMHDNYDCAVSFRVRPPRRSRRRRAGSQRIIYTDLVEAYVDGFCAGWENRGEPLEDAR